MINGLDLFSGIGGLSIALEKWVKPIAYCEIDPYCQGILLSLMGKGKLEIAPIWDDIRSFNSEKLPTGAIDIIYGGFPCQDISIATNGSGLDGKRSGLFFELLRLVGEFKPRFLFLEIEPSMGRVADGIRFRSHRLRALGNAVVPDQAKKAFEILIGIK